MDVPEAGEGGGGDREEAGDDHLLERAVGRNRDAASGVRLDRAIHDARVLAELAANLFDHVEGGVADCAHRHRAEHERQDTAEQEADDDFRRVDVERQATRSGECTGAAAECAEQSERGERCRTDCEALTDCCGRVADSVECVGALANFSGKLGHLGETTCVVSNRAVSVDAERNAERGEHADCCECNAVNASHVVGEEDRDADEQHRNRDRLHAGCETVDDVRCSASLGLLRDVLDGLRVGRGVVLGDLTDEHADHETRRDCDEERHAARHVVSDADELLGQGESAANREPCRCANDEN